MFLYTANYSIKHFEDLFKGKSFWVWTYSDWRIPPFVKNKELKTKKSIKQVNFSCKLQNIFQNSFQNWLQKFLFFFCSN